MQQTRNHSGNRGALGTVTKILLRWLDNYRLISRKGVLIANCKDSLISSSTWGLRKETRYEKEYCQ